MSIAASHELTPGAVITDQTGKALPDNPFLGTSRATLLLRVSPHLQKESKGRLLIPLLPHPGLGERFKSQEQSHAEPLDAQVPRMGGRLASAGSWVVSRNTGAHIVTILTF